MFALAKQWFTICRQAANLKVNFLFLIWIRTEKEFGIQKSDLVAHVMKKVITKINLNK